MQKENELWVPPGHFFSPIVSLSELRSMYGDKYFNPIKADELPGININKDEMVSLWNDLSPYVESSPFPEEKTEGLKYYLNNSAFVYGDGLTLYAMLRFFKPKKVIEVGSGFSSACMIETSRKYFSPPIEITCIEPYPDLLKSLVDSEQGDIKLIHQPVQKVDLEIFDTLENGDFLFIDSTHVAKTGSDVLHELFEILPRLKSGVIIHFHDIFWPFEYPKEWIFDENRSWNEAFVIRAFLTNNNDYKIIMWPHFLASQGFEFPPLFRKNNGVSLWLRKS